MVVAEGRRPEQVARVGERRRRLGRLVDHVFGEAEVLEEALVEAALDGDGARGVPDEHEERVLSRRTYAGEAQGTGVVPEVQGVLQDVVPEALLG